MPARVLNLVVRRRPRVARRDRQPAARRRALPPVAHDRVRGRRPRRTKLDATATIADRRRAASPASSRCCARRSSSSCGAQPPRAPRLDRRPARRHRPRDRACGRRTGTDEAVDALLPTWRRSCCSTRVDEPDIDDGVWRAQRARLRRASTSSTSRGCARRRGASAIAAAFDPPRCAPELGTISAMHVRHHPDSAAAGAAAGRLARVAAGLAADARWRSAATSCTGKLHARRQDVAAAARARRRR